MFLKWLPWRWAVRHVARSHGFLDPVSVMSRLASFSQPSEVAAPTELLRAGMIFHSRGLMNSQAIQHNLDWIWPYWVRKQFDPRDGSFVPRAFSLTHINLTHRNWTAVGVPDVSELPIVDPRGLVTPFHDGWSLDAWILSDNGAVLVPSKSDATEQALRVENGAQVTTDTRSDGMHLLASAEAVLENGTASCRLRYAAFAPKGGWLAVSLRPCNPEGVSFIHRVATLPDENGWLVEGKRRVYFSVPPDASEFSNYAEGDVYRKLPSAGRRTQIKCGVGMATAAALFKLDACRAREVVVNVPLEDAKESRRSAAARSQAPDWKTALAGRAELQTPDARMKFLYDAAIRSLVLHSPDDVYPGPYTYKRFWFRDAAFIVNALLAAGFEQRAERALNLFPGRQTALGYFLSQEGEWDSNGEALWIMRRFGLLSGKKPDAAWRSSVEKGAAWIRRKRLPAKKESPHAGLLPPGFSCEHLGPNDYYYWDDFWAVAGLDSAAGMFEEWGDRSRAEECRRESADLMASIEKSLAHAEKRIGRKAMPASPYRRLDTGSIGSLAAAYPLELWDAGDERTLDTARYLVDECLVDGAFFHDMSHSGVNPYLTLHIAQALMRAGDPKFFDLVSAIARMASPTGQWPEAVHPRTRGGCMGDGHHVWASAEWVLVMRNAFVREEPAERKLVLCSGVPKEWLVEGSPLSFGPTPTPYGPVTVRVETRGGRAQVSWTGAWRGDEPRIEVRLADHAAGEASPGARVLDLAHKEQGIA